MPEENVHSLNQVQNWMQAMLVTAGEHRTPGGTGDRLKPEDVIKASSNLPAYQHLAIYQQSYVARLRECMRNQFSVLAYALGNDLFQLFADDYLEAYPSNSYTLNSLGSQFPHFLEQTRPESDSEQEDWPSFMIELAQFEYDLSVIFDEYADEKESIQSAAISDDMLMSTPVFHLFHHRYPVCQYYLDFTQQRKPELPFPKENYWAVARLNYRLKLFELEPMQYVFLKSLKAGRSIQETKQYFLDNHRIDPSQLENAWGRWRKDFIAKGIFTRV
ncbi:HvfC/BufC N-terminal domain-containing protein [Spirosoma validum]|uniref:DNA-binding domain-containing protein n=1 Tax=Spirosoma validum TaxID=2771355 RepID=A0A927B5Q5_9BACT|nr:DNA-binding domain-containing protein [Spirosoma validum]MBD2756154.1 putative DNA-binding domain-containing protein [Spirosoma validum]